MQMTVFYCTAVIWWCGKRFSGNYLNQGPGQEGSYVMECSYMLYISVCYKTLFTPTITITDRINNFVT